jgi:phosphoribosyl 1,2-cyclic phosphate phosphodiesterase
VCTSKDPRDRRLRTSAVLEFVDAIGRERVVLIDAGPDLREQALRHGMRRLDAILFTHNHVDHTWGLDEVRRFNAIQDGPIDVYADEHTDLHLRRVYTHIFERERNVNDSFVASLIGHRVRAGHAFALHGLRVTPIPLLHGKLPTLGYRIEDVEGGGAGGASGALPLAYCTDVSAIPTDSWSMLRGLRTLVLDALRDRRHPTHLTLEQAVGIAERVGAAQTRFVHMSHDLGHAETMARLEASGHAPRMALAHDGATL